MDASSSGGSAASTPDVSMPNQHSGEPPNARPASRDNFGVPGTAVPAPTSSVPPASVPVSDLLELQWMDHRNIFSQNIAKLRNKHMYTDATLACDGQFYPVHKFVLATCSEFFSAMFEWTPCVNPVLVLNNILTRDLEAILDFMYTGEASVKECNLSHVMKAAQSLRVRGLAMLEESRPVMHKPPMASGGGNLATTNPANSHFSRPLNRQHSTFVDSKQSDLLGANFIEPSSKRLKSEPVEDSKIQNLSADSRSRLMKPINKPSVSLPSISSLTSPLHDTSLPKAQQTSLMHLYETSGGRATPATSQSHPISRNQAQLPRQSSSPHPHIAGSSSPHPTHAPPNTSRHLHQLLSSSKSSPTHQQVYRHSTAAAQQQQQLMQQRRKEVLMQQHQHLEAERRHLQQQLMQQGKVSNAPHSSHSQQQPHPQQQQSHHMSPHHVSSPQHHPSSQQHYQHQLPQQHQQHVALQHSRAMQPQYSQAYKQQQPQTPHSEVVERQNQSLQTSHAQHPQAQSSHGQHQQAQTSHSQHHQSQPPHPQHQHPQPSHGQHQQSQPSHSQHQQSQPSHSQHQQPLPSHPQHQQPQPPHAQHQQLQPATSITSQQLENEATNKGNESSRASELILDHQSDLGAAGLKNSNGSTPTGNNNNLATGNHNFVSDQSSPGYNCREEPSMLTPLPPPPRTGSPMSTSGTKGTSSVAVLDAAPLTPMEQQIISELGAATDGGMGSSSAADADKTADGDPAEDMLDVLVNEHSLYGFNEDPGSAEAAGAAPAVPPDGEAAEAVEAPDAAKHKDRRSTRARPPNRSFVLAKKRKRKSSSASSSDAAASSSSENAVQVHPAELASEGGVELTGADEEDALATDAAYGLTAYDNDGPGSSNTRVLPRFKCPHCPKICLKSETLAKHVLTHQNKEYSCATCNFASSDFLEVREHRRSHMSKHCSQCKFSTNRADALKKHLSMHIGSSRVGDGINSCNMCDFTPKNPATLKYHMKNHHDVDLRDNS